MEPVIVAFFESPHFALLSNFAHTPFTFCGIPFASVEAFWQSLKAENPITRRAIALEKNPLNAKRMGRSQPRKDTFIFNGGVYRVGSREHHDLLYAALLCKFKENANARELLLSTGERPFLHQYHGRRADSPTLPARVFEKMLADVRAYLRDQ